MHGVSGKAIGAFGKKSSSYDTLLVVRLVTASVVFAVSLIFGKLPGFISTLLLILSAVIAGYDIALEAVSDVVEKNYFSTSVVVTAITVLSCIIGFPAESAALVLLYQIGLILISYAEEKSRLSAIGFMQDREDGISDTVAEIVLRDGAGHTELEESIRTSAGFVLKIGMVIGVLYAVIIPFFTNFSFTVSIHRALTVILISTPMSVVISMPTAAVMGMCYSAKYGVIFSSASAMEDCAEAKTVIFDNSGVFSDNEPEITDIRPQFIDKNTFLTFAAHVLYYSEQSAAKAVSDMFSSDYRLELIENFKDYPGYGAEADIGGAHVIIGTRDLFFAKNISLSAQNSAEGLFLYMTIADRYVGYIELSSAMNEGGEDLVIRLKENGISRCVLLCEQGEADSRSIAEELDFREVYGECDRERKLQIIDDLSDSVKGCTAFVYSAGFDGHSAADVDIRVSDHARFADVLVSPDCVANIPFAFGLCRRTKEIAVENAIFAFVIKAILIFLSIIGYCNLWFAIFVDMVAAVGTILNTVRVTSPSLISQLFDRDDR